MMESVACDDSLREEQVQEIARTVNARRTVVLRDWHAYILEERSDNFFFNHPGTWHASPWAMSTPSKYQLVGATRAAERSRVLGHREV
jgi:alpha-ketoglutarate-dependent taurine dioxygenase